MILDDLLQEAETNLDRRGFITLSIGWPRDYTTRQSPAMQPLSWLAS